MSKFSRYHSIGQFKNVLKQVQHDTAFQGLDDDGNPINDWNKLLPTLTFTGSEKLHGTNAAIGFEAGRVEWSQSRERILSLENDNAGFCQWVDGNRIELNHIGAHIYANTDTHFDSFLIYGEWCGSNIQPQVVLSKLPKQFIVFGIKLRKGAVDIWLSDREVKLLLENKLKTIFDYPTYVITINFNNPTEAINQMVSITNEVEAHSPIGLAHGIDGIGEGVVWKCNDYIFKVKGRLHSSSHTKELIPIDAEKVKNIKDCVDKIVSENRLRQGLDYLKENNIPADNKAIGPFINWVKYDCIKEELDIILGSDLKIEDVVKEISLKSKMFFIDDVIRK